MVFSARGRRAPEPAVRPARRPRRLWPRLRRARLRQADHSIVEMGLEVLRKMEHRGATGADPETGDGAGLMLQLPDRFFRRWAREEVDTELPPPGEYAVAMCFLPRDPALRLICEELLVRITHEEGQVPLGWRDVPVDSAHVGRLARESEPVIRQLFVARGRGVGADAFRRKLYVIRRRVELASAGAPGRPRRRSRSRASRTRRSPTRACYRASQLGRYYPDLQEPLRRVGDRARALALLDEHARHLGPRPAVQPTSRTTARSTPCAATAPGCTRASRSLRSALLGDDLAEALPDHRRALVRLRGARRRARAARDGGPHAGARADDADPRRLDRTTTRCRTSVRAFYEFHAALRRALGRPGRGRLHATAARSAPRSTATACARRATRSRATAWWCSRRRPACSTSTPPTSSSTTASSPAACCWSTPSPAASSATTS